MAEIASHSRMRDICGDLCRKLILLYGNFDYTAGASARNDYFHPDTIETISDMDVKSLDKLIPRIAKDQAEIDRLREIVASRETRHKIYVGDARDLSVVPEKAIHLVVTSPPYWNLKRYNEHSRQMGHIDDYQEFLDQLDVIWRQCFEKLVEGGRMVVVVGDVLLSRRQFGRHKVVPLHADIQVRCEKIGFDNLRQFFGIKSRMPALK